MLARDANGDPKPYTAHVTVLPWEKLPRLLQPIGARILDFSPNDRALGWQINRFPQIPDTSTSFCYHDTARPFVSGF